MNGYEAAKLIARAELALGPYLGGPPYLVDDWRVALLLDNSLDLPGVAEARARVAIVGRFHNPNWRAPSDWGGRLEGGVWKAPDEGPLRPPLNVSQRVADAAVRAIFVDGAPLEEVLDELVPEAALRTEEAIERGDLEVLS